MKQPSTLQENYNAIKSGTGHKDVFLKEAKRLYSSMIPNAATFEQTVHIFKNRGVLNENYVDLKPITQWEGTKKEPWENKFAQFIQEQEATKAETTKISKNVEDAHKNNFDYSDVKNLDNQIGQEVLNGIYLEAKENPTKTLDEIREIVSKNLAKDRLYYVKNGMFGVKGAGVSDEVPGLKVSKTDQMTPVKMKSLNENNNEKYNKKIYNQTKDFKTSNKDVLRFVEQYNKYDDADIITIYNRIWDRIKKGNMKNYPENVLALTNIAAERGLHLDGVHGIDMRDEVPEDDYSYMKSLNETINEAKATKLDQRLKDIHKAGDLITLEAKMEAIDEEIKTRQERINMIGENEDLAELVNPAKLRELQKEVKLLEKNKAQYQKLYEKMTGKKKAEVIDEPQEVEDDEATKREESPYEDIEHLYGDDINKTKPIQETLKFRLKK